MRFVGSSSKTLVIRSTNHLSFPTPITSRLSRVFLRFVPSSLSCLSRTLCACLPTQPSSPCENTLSLSAHLHFMGNQTGIPVTTSSRTIPKDQTSNDQLGYSFRLGNFLPGIGIASSRSGGMYSTVVKSRRGLSSQNVQVPKSMIVASSPVSVASGRTRMFSLFRSL